MLPDGYKIRLMQPADFNPIIELCKRVYPTEVPYTVAELSSHVAVFPQGQFVADHVSTGTLAGVHFTLRLQMSDLDLDDSWDILTSGGSFSDHDPDGTTLYGADIMVSPDHQHHGLAHALTDSARFLVQEEQLWRMVGASRLPGYGKVATTIPIEAYIAAVLAQQMFDPVLSLHIKDGWSTVKPIHGYLQHDEESDGWAEVIQWVNPACPPPEFDLRKLRV